MHDLAPFVARLERALERCWLREPGVWRRFRDEADDAAPNAYGCADAVNLLYTLGRLPREPKQRAACVEHLRDLQDPASGLFREATHHEIHTTAHCLGALELFDTGPRHRLAALAFLDAPGAVEAFLDGLDWRGNPWLESHRGSGVYAARVLAGEATPEFEERYFAWLARESDPETGLWRRGQVEPPYAWGTNRFPHLAGSFHYVFNHEWARRPLPHPAPLVDTCLELYATREYPLATTVGFAEVDWVYCLTRSLAQCGHRRPEALRALESFADEHAAFLLGIDLEEGDAARDLHALFGAVCALAELQRVLPGRLRTRRPLKLVLDRRPFI